MVSRHEMVKGLMNDWYDNANVKKSAAFNKNKKLYDLGNGLPLDSRILASGGKSMQRFFPSEDSTQVNTANARNSDLKAVHPRTDEVTKRPVPPLSLSKE